MKPGRELDALIAEKVMGLSPVLQGELVEYSMPNGGIVTLPFQIPHYSTEIAAAWEVIERFLAGWKNAHVDLSCEPQGVAATFSWYEGEEFATSPSAPHAICLAALKVIKV